MAPIMKKPSLSTSGKGGTGSLGKSASLIGKNTSMGSSGKSTNVLGSSSKSNKLVSSSGGSGYTSKSSSSSYMGLSGRSDGLLGSSAKSNKSMAASLKTTSADNSGKGTSAFGSSGKTASFMGYSAKTESPLGSSAKSKPPTPSEKTSFLPPVGKSSNVLGASDKNKSSIFSGKSTPEASRNYPTFINPVGSKSKTRIGIIWIPTRKRNKKKDMVFNSNNHRYKEKGPSMYSYMSGDSPSYQQPHKKKEEETDLLVSERPKVATVAVNTGITAASIDIPTDDSTPGKPEEKQEFIRRDTEESKEAAGDTNEIPRRNDSDYLENKDNDTKSQDSKWNNEKGDKVDSVYLRPPPLHKSRSATSANEDEDCGIKCLYYTLQCCDCVLM